MKRILLLAASILLALAAQDNLQRRAMVTDAVLLYAAAAVAFVWAMAGLDRWLEDSADPPPPAQKSQGIGGGVPHPLTSPPAASQSGEVGAQRDRRTLWVRLWAGLNGGTRGTGFVASVPGAGGTTRTVWSLLAAGWSLPPVLLALWAWSRNHFATSESTYALLVYLAGLAILIFALVQLGKAEGPAPASFRRVFSRRDEWLLVAGVTALAAFMVFYLVESLPYGVWYDEADSGLEALQVMNGAPYSPAAFHFRYNPSLYFQYLGVVFKVFGVGVAQIRYATGVLGIVAVPAFYLLARELFGQRAALVAAFFLAVSRWHFNFARWGMSNVGATVFGVLGFYFLFRALRYRRWSDFAWAGLLFGGGLHTYTAFRLVPLAAATVAVYWVLACEVAPRLASHDWPGLSAASKGLTLRFSVLLIAALVAFGPLGVYALQNPAEFNQRLDQTSVFARKDTDAQKIAALESNVQKHLLMFNYQGDGNGRHNLPGEPMLDPTTGAFLILGVAYAGFKWRDPVRMSLLLWLAVTLQAGILSLDFEAPQGARTLVAVPPLLLLAAWPLGATWTLAANFTQSWTWSREGRRLAAGVTAALAALLLARAGLYNFETYFFRQANDFAVWSAFSTPETLVAREANALGKGYSYYLANFFQDHPTIKFLAPWLTDYQTVSSDMIFPLAQAGDRPVAIFLDAQKTVAYAAGRRYYPAGGFQERQPPFGGPAALYEILLTPDDIRSIQGLDVRYYQGTAWQGQPLIQRKEPTLEADWRTSPPVDGPFSVEWTGTLYVPAYWPEILVFTAPAEAQVMVDENPFLTVPASGGSVQKTALLARGNHALRVRAVGGPGPIRLAWQIQGGDTTTIPQGSLYVPPVRANGLLGTYFRGANWEGLPGLQQVDPSLALYFHLTPLPRPYSVEWTGKLRVPVSGTYAFGLESIDDSWLYLDGGARPVVEAHVQNLYAEARTSLSAGLHDVRVRFVDKSGYSHLNLFWTPPGGAREIIPSERLFPPQGAYPAAQPTTTGQTPGAARPESPGTGATTSTLVFQESWGAGGEATGEFREPRDIAADPSGTIYVADTGNRRVQVFNRDGKVTGVLTADFEEPLALVVDSRRNLIVLDSAAGWLYRFDASGAPLGRLGGPDAQLYHPRGMAIDSSDNLYVADTGGSRIVKFSPDGVVVARYGSMGSGRGELLEPTDVVVESDGSMYVADTGNKRIVRLDAAGSYLGEWAYRQAAPFNGVHLALASGGRLLATDPDGAKVVTFDSGGRLLQEAGAWGSSANQFDLPVGLAVGGDQRVYVADTGNNRVQVLAFGQ